MQIGRVQNQTKVFMSKLMLLLLVCSFPSFAGFDEGREAYKIGDYSTAKRVIKPLAEQGDANAQNLLGVMYSSGHGVQQDHSQAVQWFRKAAEQGHTDAQVNLGYSYFSGQGVQQDYAQSIQWYRKAAEQGNAEAQFNLGFSYANGNGVSKDPAQAVQWYLKAAEQGHTNAQVNLGYCYFSGQGVQQDYAQSIQWFLKAADQGIAEATSAIAYVQQQHEDEHLSPQQRLTKAMATTDLLDNPEKLMKMAAIFGSNGVMDKMAYFSGLARKAKRKAELNTYQSLILGDVDSAIAAAKLSGSPFADRPVKVKPNDPNDDVWKIRHSGGIETVIDARNMLNLFSRLAESEEQTFTQELNATHERQAMESERKERKALMEEQRRALQTNELLKLRLLSGDRGIGFLPPIGGYGYW